MSTVSVIIPCFNHRNSIVRAINSALNQTYPVNEVLVIDDGSVDGSAELVKDLIDRHQISNVRLIKNPINLGSSYSRNSGWDSAKSDYVAFLDADDEWTVDKVSLQIQFFKKNPNFSVCGHIFGNLNSTLGKIGENFDLISYNRLLIKNYFSTPTMMLRADLKYRFPVNRRLAEDYSLWLDLAHNLGAIPKLNQCLARCDKNFYGDGGLSRNVVSMEIAEISVLYEQYENERIGFILLVILAIFSITKFIFRILKIFFRKKLMKFSG